MSLRDTVRFLTEPADSKDWGKERAEWQAAKDAEKAAKKAAEAARKAGK
jgi:hypothetical protein